MSVLVLVAIASLGVYVATGTLADRDVPTGISLKLAVVNHAPSDTQLGQSSGSSSNTLGASSDSSSDTVQQSPGSSSEVSRQSEGPPSNTFEHSSGSSSDKVGHSSGSSSNAFAHSSESSSNTSGQSSGSSSSEFDQSAGFSSSTDKRLAYMFYVTSDTYACAALHLIDHLTALMDTSRIELVVLHAPSVIPTMLERLRAVARVIPVDVMRTNGLDATWQQSLTKLQAFRDWGYDRVVFMDADSVPLQSLDHLFDLPSAPLYAPRAYWLRQPFFASTLLVIEPSDARFQEIVAWARARGDAAGFDMDILNAFFKDTVQYLPGDYTVLNSDFRAKPDAPNKLYATTTELKQHTKMVHFSCKPDGSYGKPWSSSNHDLSFAAKKGLDPLFAELFENYWAFAKRVCK